MTRADLKLVPIGSATLSVAPRCKQETINVIPAFDRQLRLPFDDSASRRIIIVAMDCIHGIQLCNLILDIKPKKAIDLRYLIRFDLPGTNRSEIFHRMKLVRTHYVKASLPWHQLSARDFMLGNKQLSDQLDYEIMGGEESPLLLLASKDDDVRNLTSYLNRLLSSHSTSYWQIEFAR